MYICAWDKFNFQMSCGRTYFTQMQPHAKRIGILIQAKDQQIKRQACKISQS